MSTGTTVGRATVIPLLTVPAMGLKWLISHLVKASNTCDNPIEGLQRTMKDAIKCRCRLSVEGPRHVAGMIRCRQEKQ